jgi:hypothetical protein
VKCSAYSDIDYSCESSPGTGGPGYHVTLDSEGNVSSYSRPCLDQHAAELPAVDKLQRPRPIRAYSKRCGVKVDVVTKIARAASWCATAIPKNVCTSRDPILFRGA